MDKGKQNRNLYLNLSRLSDIEMTWVFLALLAAHEAEEERAPHVECTIHFACRALEDITNPFARKILQREIQRMENKYGPLPEEIAL